MALYPLKFRSRFVEKMWGGRKLSTLLNRPLPDAKPIGESWELFDFPPGIIEGHPDSWVSAEIANGPLAGKTLHDLMVERPAELMGSVPPLVNPQSPIRNPQFPILIKFLDAREDLSVQVHPPQHYCDRHPEAHLKSEAWYVLQSDPGARILKGLKPNVTRPDFESATAKGTVDTLIESIPVKPGHCHYLPSGTVHALGSGILAAEVQTPSDTTFRVFDFNRADPSTGKPRTLHVQQALECINFDKTTEPNQPRSHVASHFTTVSRLVTSPYFTLEKVRMTEGVHEPIPYDQPVVWMFLEGHAELSVADLNEPVRLSPGETVLLPAKMNRPMIKTLKDSAWLEVTLPSA